MTDSVWHGSMLMARVALGAKRVWVPLAVGLGFAVGQAQAQTSPPAQPTVAAAKTGGLKPIFVLNSRDASVSMIDSVTFKEERRIEVGKEPHHIYLTPDEKSLIVANAASNSLTFIDPVTGAVQRTVRDIPDPYHLRFSPDMKWFITAANRLDHIDIYQWLPNEAMPLKLVKRVQAPKTPSHLSIDSKSTVLYASLQDSDEMMAIDLGTQAIRWKIKVGDMPADVFLTRDDKHLLLGLTGDKFVEVYDVSQAKAGVPPKLVKRITTGKGAHAFRSRGDGKHVFVSNRVANTVNMIDLNTFEVVGDAMPGGNGPDCMDVTADGKTLLLSSRWANKLTHIDIDSRKIVRQTPVGRSPHGVWTLDHAPRH
jgi:YVTN family beta-propeller protein